ncbi:MAG: SH3 domain-containing protein [Clostridia bacterium]|nr:SH3 domain-containing protein [Clostridia bacterium]
MSGKRTNENSEGRSKNISTREYALNKRNESRAVYDNSRYSKRARVEDFTQRDYDDRSATRRKGRAGCLVSIALFAVIMAGLYIIIFHSPWFKRETSIDADTTAQATQYAVSTPTPTAKPEPTEVPSPTPVPVSTIGYISTEDTDGVVRVREEANRSSDILGELHNREVLYILGKEGEYYKIRYQNQSGYVQQDYVEEHLPADNMLCDVVTHEIAYSKLVEVTQIVPELIVEMPYITESNHINKKVYPFELVLLQETTAQKLKKAQEMFLEDGYSLVIWDAYRPYSVTVQIFEVIQDPKLAADPEVGSKHNRGAALDVTLYNLKTEEYVDMPTEVREMDKALASRTSSYMTSEQRANMNYMQGIMEQAGFSPYMGEWWHYNDMDTADYPVLDIQFEAWEGR